MNKKEAIKIFGSLTQLAKFVGVSKQSACQWTELPRHIKLILNEFKCKAAVIGVRDKDARLLFTAHADKVEVNPEVLEFARSLQPTQRKATVKAKKKATRSNQKTRPDCHERAEKTVKRKGINKIH